MNTDTLLSIKKGVETVIGKHRQREYGIKIIKHRIAQLNKEIDRGGNLRELNAEIRGLEFALEKLGT